MPVTYMKHTETWNLDINREPGDEWPDMPVQYSGVRDAMFRPDLITVAIRRGGNVTFSVHGRRIRKDGTPGLNGTSSIRHGSEPKWAADVVAAARAEHNLTEEALGR